MTLLAVLAGMLALAGPPAARAASMHPLTARIGSASPGRLADTIPHWSGAFRYLGHTYHYTMVGTNPALGGVRTTVPTVIIPLRIVFGDGSVFDGSRDVASTVASPIFHPAQFSSGLTQYGDAIQRAEFWRSAGGSGYHVLLGQPDVRPAITIDVPAGVGSTTTAPSGAHVGLIKIGWFYYHQIIRLMQSRRIPANVLPIFLSRNVLLYGGNPRNCCVIGLHAARRNGANTMAWSSYTSSGVFPPSDGITDVNILSHEISEWYNDPFLTNQVPGWSVPTQPQYGCSPDLEVGDPLVGVSFVRDGYSLQDEAFFSWFARQAPSQGIGGRYTYLGTFGRPPPVCS